ncbi:hypothetical protein BCR34DRAFT_582472 [Clohesyomyces aquaticus]|uniref:Uncharacterized protein n=1 Tax=Clohesyomyces aquaticus TaxID=1231657 RepID=A0A1Y2A9Z6_9PLEO|nr:hypothetical protein BCR34DRAFT_582472 [Clohesyomyces aquaticus]
MITLDGLNVSSLSLPKTIDVHIVFPEDDRLSEAERAYRTFLLRPEQLPAFLRYVRMFDLAICYQGTPNEAPVPYHSEYFGGFGPGAKKVIVFDLTVPDDMGAVNYAPNLHYFKLMHGSLHKCSVKCPDASKARSVEKAIMLSQLDKIARIYEACSHMLWIQNLIEEHCAAGKYATACDLLTAIPASTKSMPISSLHRLISTLRRPRQSAILHSRWQGESYPLSEFTNPRMQALLAFVKGAEQLVNNNEYHAEMFEPVEEARNSLAEQKDRLCDIGEFQLQELIAIPAWFNAFYWMVEPLRRKSTYTAKDDSYEEDIAQMRVLFRSVKSWKWLIYESHIFHDFFREFLIEATEENMETYNVAQYPSKEAGKGKAWLL